MRMSFRLGLGCGAALFLGFVGCRGREAPASSQTPTRAGKAVLLRPASLTPPSDAVPLGELFYKQVGSRGDTRRASETSISSAAVRLSLGITVWDENGLRAQTRESYNVVVDGATVSRAARLMTQMRSGARCLFWVPEEAKPPIVYPEERPAGRLLYRIDVTKVQQGPEPPTEMVPPRGAHREPGGWSWVRLQKGTGDTRPRRDNTVSIELSVWSTAGKLLFTSLWARALVVRVADAAYVLPEALVSMVAGERRRLWVPRGQANGEDVVVDLELTGVDSGVTEFLLDPEDSSERLVVRGRKNYLFRKGTNVRQLPERSPAQPPP